jgi:hypothetical protein
MSYKRGLDNVTLFLNRLKKRKSSSEEQNNKKKVGFKRRKLNSFKEKKFNKNRHKVFYEDKPFLKRERWPRKLIKLILKWRFKKINTKNKYMWLKFQKKRIFKYYNIFKKKKKNNVKLKTRFFVVKNFRYFYSRYIRRRFLIKEKKKNERVLNLSVIKKVKI